MSRYLVPLRMTAIRFRLRHFWSWSPQSSFLKRSHSTMSTTTISSTNGDKILESPLSGVIEVPNVSLPEYLWKDAAKYSSLPAVTCGKTNRSYTYGMAQAASRRFANALATMSSLSAGDVMGVLLPNIPEYFIAILGALEAGLVVTFVNPLYTPDEIQRQFTSAGVVCSITIPELLPIINIVGQKLPKYFTTIVIGSDAHQENGSILSFKKLLDDSLPANLPKPLPGNLAVLPYSSGTTGLPKGVKLTHYNLVANLMQMDHPDLTDYKPTTETCQDKVLSVLPFFHIYGFNAIMNSCIAHGVHLISIPKFTPEDYLTVLTVYKPDVLILVPSLLLFLTSHPAVQSHHLESITKVVCGAAPATKNIIDKFIKKVNRENITVQQGYGMTESSPVTLCTPTSASTSKHGSCGQLIPLTQAKIVDLTTGESLAPHQSGELFVRGPQIMQGYLNDEQATKETVDSQGWLHTGDVAYYDEDGYFYIVDRTKELIKVKGNQRHPMKSLKSARAMPSYYP